MLSARGAHPAGLCHPTDSSPQDVPHLKSPLHPHWAALLGGCGHLICNSNTARGVGLLFTTSGIRHTAGGLCPPACTLGPEGASVSGPFSRAGTQFGRLLLSRMGAAWAAVAGQPFQQRTHRLSRVLQPFPQRCDWASFVVQARATRWHVLSHSRTPDGDALLKGFWQAAG